MTIPWKLRSFKRSRTKRQVNAFSLCRDLPPNTRFNICVSHPPDSRIRVSRLDFVKLMCYHLMFQHGVDFYRTFTVGHCTGVVLPSNEIRLRKSSAKVTIFYEVQEEILRNVCKNLKFCVNYTRTRLCKCQNWRLEMLNTTKSVAHHHKPLLRPRVIIIDDQG